MSLKEGTALYVRIDYKIEGKVETEKDAMDCFNYLQEVAKERYLLAGVFGDMELGNLNGAMLLFEAETFEEAQKVAQSDPIIERGFYKYELFKWNLMLSPEGAGK